MTHWHHITSYVRSFCVACSLGQNLKISMRLFHKTWEQTNSASKFYLQKTKYIKVINSTIYFPFYKIFSFTILITFLRTRIQFPKVLYVCSFSQLSIFTLSVTIFSKTSFHIFFHSQKFVDIKISKINCVKLRKLFHWSFPFFYLYFKASYI